MSGNHSLLIKVQGDASTVRPALSQAFGVTQSDVEPILEVPASSGRDQGVAARGPSTWLKVSAPQASANPWDSAHALLARSRGFGARAAPAVEAIEPDLQQTWNLPDPGLDHQQCKLDDQEAKGGKELGTGAAWNLGSSFSQLADARKSVGAAMSNVVIAHLDTGFDPDHVTRPVNLNTQLQRNFVDDGFAQDDARDHVPPGSLMTNRGHGTGTLSLLAGAMFLGKSDPWSGFNDYIGGAPLATIIPIRIANWVVRFSVSTMVKGFKHACDNKAHVLSMSMGGVSSQALVDAVNVAYEAGMTIVTAAGNNYSGLPTPKSIVFPARYRRVLAACGVMAKGSAYDGLSFGTMQGNYGPMEKMDTALGAYTPNVPWAKIGCKDIIDMDGSGTSAATPQIAAAAALWIAKNATALAKYPERWMCVEAVRYALFSAAQKTTPRMDAATTLQKLGQGVMRAADALAVAPLTAAQLAGRMSPTAKASWSWIDLIFGHGGVSVAAATQGDARRAMLALELTQLAQLVPEVDAAIRNPEVDPKNITDAERSQYFEAALDSGKASKVLRTELERRLGKTSVVLSTTPISSSPKIKRKWREAPIPQRRLRVYALDPSTAKRLASVSVNETVLSLPWDDVPATFEPLRPGPVGEYLEVVDVDPASGKVYEPVDLNDHFVLAQDGWAPSEGNPAFHQQMVYAVGMATIRHFEIALGRRALWAPRYASVTTPDGEEKSKAYEVPRLRIYPHALREANAYYSPQKIALLFGYFQSESANTDATAPGSMVFSCLSSDIISHEMTHALLDGLHRRFQEASNPDVPAFHEGFADIVALFQHFTMKELVKFEIARARGDLSADGLLSGLAEQFGEGISRSGPLRNYRDPAMKKLRYADTQEPHDRGSILVFAVYEAFVNIVERRTMDLLRIATGGTGLLPDGALHPDLVHRLTEETCAVAKHVLHMCIRALDYCPAVDITFGEFLRALITADLDMVPLDRWSYRVAFMEAFRNRGILPRDVRTISEESLSWNTPENSSPAWLDDVLKNVDLRWNQDLDRSEIFALNESNRWSMWSALKKVFAADASLYAEFGLAPNLPRFDQDGKVIRTPGPGETTFEVYSVRPARRVAPDGSFRTDVIAVIHQRRAVPIDGVDVANGFFWFRGGATLVIDPRADHREIRYSVTKNIESSSRLERQRQTAIGNFVSPLRGLYFGESHSEPFALLHTADREL